MQRVPYQSIQKMARHLAGNLLALWGERAQPVPEAWATAGRLAVLLEPGVAALTGRLLVLAPEQEDRVPPVIDRYFNDPATAETLDRAIKGEAGAIEGLGAGLFLHGLEPHSRLNAYLYQAVEMLLAAFGVSLMAAAEEERAGPESLRSLAVALNISEYILDEMQYFVTKFTDMGLDHIEPGQAIAADGQTILYAWEPALMAGTPPDEIQESVGEWTGEPQTAGESGEPETASELPPPPQPPAPQPANGGSTPPVAGNGGSTAPEIVDLRLDAALPERVTVGRPFEIAIAVRRPASPPLAPDDLARRESAAFAAVWPDDAAFIQLRVQVSAPECAIHNGDSRQFRLLAGQDGPTVYFQLTPQRAGPLSVIITVYQEMDWVGSTRLRTEAGTDELRGAMSVTVDSRPLGNAEVNHVVLWKALTEGYNDAELRDLLFEMGIEYDDLPGDTKSAKARELVSYAQRHGRTGELVAKIMAGRPHLLAPA